MMHDYIQHYGVLGMKWGIRKHFTNPFKVSKRKPKKSSVRKKSSGSSELKISDKRLNERVERLQLEKKYKELKRVDISLGKTLIGKIAWNSVDNIGNQLLESYKKQLRESENKR